MGSDDAPRFDLSTVAEPLAISRVLRWLGSREGQAVLHHHASHIDGEPACAVITDHSPVVKGQRRLWSGNGGFSLNPFLNETFAEMARWNAIARST
jgi:hypothetical protein